MLLVLGHSRTSGLGHHLLSVARDALRERGVAFRVHDLLGDGFDPVLRMRPDQIHAERCSADEDALVHGYQEDVRWADRYIILHPVWWFAPPAILKGWVDRVLVDGVAIEQTENGSPRGLLGDRKALVVQTFNAARTVDKVVFRGLAGLFWKRAVFLPTGIHQAKRFALYGVQTISPRKLEARSRRLAELVAGLVG